MKFADVKNDVAFRKIFGNENRKEVLISFLNAILEFEGKQCIIDVKIINPYQLPKLSGGKVTIIDVKATDQSGRQYIVEMQVAEKKDFAKRVLYYTAKSYSDQIKRGDFYRKLKPAIFIGILDFRQTQNENYLSRNRILDIDTGEHTIKDVEFTFIELPKFKLKEDELQSLSEKWIYFIKNAENLTVLPDNINDNGLKSAYEEANQYTWSREELDAYDYVYMREEDARAERDFIKEKMKEAEEEKRKAEEEKRKAEEKTKIAEEEKQKAEEKLKTGVIGLYKNNVPISIISLSLNMAEEKINAIIADFE